MKENRSYFKWLIRVMILSSALTLGMTLFASQAFATDIMAPRVITITPNKDASTNRTVIIEADYEDDETGVDEPTVNVKVSSAVISDCVKLSRRVSCKASNVEDGDHDIQVEIRDKNNNTSSSSKRFRYDEVPPVIDSIVAIPEKITVTFHDQAPSSGIASVSVTVDGQKLDCCGCSSHTNGLGPYLGEGHCSHGEGNGYGHYMDFFTDSLDGSATSTADFTCPILAGLTCGTHTVVVSITDRAGNNTTQSNVFQIGDCTPPVTTDNAPTGWQNTDVNLALTCTDTGSGCASTTYEVNAGASQYGNTVSLTTDGIHTITYHSTDVAGNIEATKTANVMIDKTPPVVTTSGDVTVEAIGPDGAPASYTAGATDALSGTTGPSCAPASGSTFPLGATTVTCTATDAAGNTGTGSTTVTVVDTTPPVVTVLPASQTIEATGPDGAMASYTASAADAVYGSPAVSCSPASGSTFPLGTTTVSCTSTDAAGNTGTGSATVTVVDTTAPAVTYISPVDTIYDTTGPTITGTATDAVGVTSASASIGGTSITCTVDGSGNVSCPTSGLAYGWHTAVITAQDAVGNTGSATSTFCVSSGRPNLMLYKVRGPYVVAGDPYRWVTVDYRMDNSGPGAYNVRMLSMTATNGIYLSSPLPLPLMLGNIAPGGAVSFSVKYYWPVGVTSYLFTNTACAEDQCFTEYFYP